MKANDSDEFEDSDSEENKDVANLLSLPNDVFGHMVKVGEISIRDFIKTCDLSKSLGAYCNGRNQHLYKQMLQRYFGINSFELRGCDARILLKGLHKLDKLNKLQIQEIYWPWSEICNYLSVDIFLRELTKLREQKYNTILTFNWSFVKFLFIIPDNIILAFQNEYEIDDIFDMRISELIFSNHMQGFFTNKDGKYEFNIDTHTYLINDDIKILAKFQTKFNDRDQFLINGLLLDDKDIACLNMYKLFQENPIEDTIIVDITKHYIKFSNGVNFRFKHSDAYSGRNRDISVRTFKNSICISYKFGKNLRHRICRLHIIVKYKVSEPTFSNDGYQEGEIYIDLI